MNDVKVGSAWEETSKKGNPYISIRLTNGMRVAMFKNDEKRGENSPDYRLRMDAGDAEKLGLPSEYTRALKADEAKGMVQQELGAKEDKPDEEVPF